MNMYYRIAALLCAMVLLLAGCGGGGNTQAPSASGSAPAAELSQPAPAAEPSQPAPEKLVIGIAQDFDSLDPGKSAATGTQEVMFNIFHGLINTTPDGAIVPELCESYEVSEDLLTYTFYLRRDVKFHNAQPMTALDVVYTYLRMMGRTPDQQEPLVAEFSTNIKEVSARDDYTVVFELNEPSAAFISLCIMGVIPEGSGEEQAKQPVGAGPYQYASYSPGVGITMTRFEDYYGEAPFFKEVEFKIFSDITTVQMALQNGELHIMKFEESVFSYDENKLKLVKQPQNMVQMLAFNHEFEPFSHLEVRQAVNYAVDKQAIIDSLSAGSLRIDTNFSPVMSFYYNFELENYYPRDVEKAKSLLAAAGYPDLSFTVKVPSEYKFHLDTAQIIQQQLSEAGITMKIEPIEWNTWLSEVYAEHNHEATIVGLTGKIDPGSVMIRPTSGYSRNFFKYNNPEYDRLVAEAAREADQDKRAELYKAAQAAATQDALMVPLMDPGNNLLMSRQIEGYQTYPIGYIDLRSITWSE